MVPTLAGRAEVIECASADLPILRKRVSLRGGLSILSQPPLAHAAWKWFVVFAAALCSTATSPAGKPAPEPQVTSLFPMGGQRGVPFRAVIRGTALQGARALVFEDSSVTGRVLPEETRAPGASNTADLLAVEISAERTATPGWHKLWVVTPAGFSNPAAVRIVEDPVIERADRAQPASHFPIVVNGRIREPGTAEAYWIEASAGETLTFEAISGNPRFDPVLTLYEPSGSWFDPSRLNRIAFNDEPLYFPGLSTDARIVWRCAHSGTYCIRVQGFTGQGAPDDVYQLRITRGATAAPPLHPKIEAAWEERQFVRAIRNNWLDELFRRGGSDTRPSPPEVFHAATHGAPQVPAMKLPALIEGRLTRPAEAQSIRLTTDKPEDLAIEVETPEATRPRFNPVVRLLDSAGHEIVTNIYNRVNNNNLRVMKMIQPKTVVSLRAPGEYTMQIHDIATDYASDDFAYRILVRRQIPHVGNIDIRPDHINLLPGSSKPITISIEREEGFAGLVAVNVKGLPQGVVEMPALADVDDPPRLENAGKRERYFPKRQSITVMLTAAPEAAATRLPVQARVELSVAAGRSGPPITMKEIPIMVLDRGTS